MICYQRACICLLLLCACRQQKTLPRLFPCIRSILIHINKLILLNFYWNLIEMDKYHSPEENQDSEGRTELGYRGVLTWCCLRPWGFNPQQGGKEEEWQGRGEKAKGIGKGKTGERTGGRGEQGKRGKGR